MKKVEVTRVLFVKDKSLFLMLRNGKKTSHGQGVKRWITPGGVVDPGETPVQAAIRETEEEIGITLAEKDLTLIYQRHDPQYDAEMYFYLCSVEIFDKLVVKEPEKFDKVEWVSFKELKSLEKKSGAKLGVFTLEAVNQIGGGKKSPPVFHKW